MSGFSFPPPPPPPPKPAQSQQNLQNRGSERSRGISRGGRGQRGNPTSSSRGNHRQDGFPSQGSWQHMATQNPGQPQSRHQGPSLPSGAFVNPSFAGSQSNLNRGNESGYPPRTEAGHKRKLDALRRPPREKKPAPPTAPAVPSFGAAVLQSTLSPTAKSTQNKPSISSEKAPAKRSLGLTPATEDPQYSSSESEDGDQEVDEEAAYAELGNKLAFEHNGVLVSLSSQADLAAWRKERQKNWPTKQRMAEKYRQRQKIGDERKRLLAHTQPLEPSARVREWRAPRVSESGNDVGAIVGATEQNSAQVDVGAVVPKTKFEKARDEVAEKTKQLDELRRRVKESEARNRNARAEQSATIEMQTAKDHGASEMDTSVAPQPPQIIEPEGLEDAVARDSVESSQESLDESSSVISSDSPSEVDSDNEAPEQMSIAPPSAETSGKPTTVCRYFAASGCCRDGDACRFKHERPPQQPGGGSQLRQPPQMSQNSATGGSSNRIHSEGERKGIFERLLEQQQAEEDRLALKVIKYLGSVGFFKEDSPTEDA